MEMEQKVRIKIGVIGVVMGLAFIPVCERFNLDTKAKMAMTEARYNISVALMPEEKESMLAKLNPMNWGS